MNYIESVRQKDSHKVSSNQFTQMMLSKLPYQFVMSVKNIPYSYAYRYTFTNALNKFSRENEYLELWKCLLPISRYSNNNEYIFRFVSIEEAQKVRSILKRAFTDIYENFELSYSEVKYISNKNTKELIKKGLCFFSFFTKTFICYDFHTELKGKMPQSINKNQVKTEGKQTYKNRVLSDAKEFTVARPMNTEMMPEKLVNLAKIEGQVKNMVTEECKDMSYAHFLKTKYLEKYNIYGFVRMQVPELCRAVEYIRPGIFNSKHIDLFHFFNTENIEVFFSKGKCSPALYNARVHGTEFSRGRCIAYVNIIEKDNRTSFQFAETVNELLKIIEQNCSHRMKIHIPVKVI